MAQKLVGLKNIGGGDAAPFTSGRFQPSASHAPVRLNLEVVPVHCCDAGVPHHLHEGEHVERASLPRCAMCDAPACRNLRNQFLAFDNIVALGVRRGGESLHCLLRNHRHRRPVTSSVTIPSTSICAVGLVTINDAPAGIVANSSARARAMKV